MSRRTKVTVGSVTASAWCLMVVVACGGKGKPAESPGTCPEGTVLTGESCLPATAESEAKKPSDDDSPKGATKASAPSAPPEGGDAGGAGADEGSGGGSYDKDAVEAQLKRAAKQVKGNCGSASDEEGNRNGPWGTATATIVLGRNGHVREVSVPPPYAKTPAGDCVVNSFKKLVYPPYAGSSDASVTWPVELVKPKP